MEDTFNPFRDGGARPAQDYRQTPNLGSTAGAPESGFDPFRDGGAQASPGQENFNPFKDSDASLTSPEDIQARVVSDPSYNPNKQELQTLYAHERGKSIGTKALDVAKGVGRTVGGVVKDAALSVPELPGLVTNPGKAASTATEGLSQAATGLVKIPYKLVAGPLSYLGHAVQDSFDPTGEDDRDYARWEKDYLTNLALQRSGGNSVQLQKTLGVENPVAPAEHTASTIATVAPLLLPGGQGVAAESGLTKAIVANAGKAVERSAGEKLVQKVGEALEGAGSVARKVGAAPRNAIKSAVAPLAGDVAADKAAVFAEGAVAHNPIVQGLAAAEGSGAAAEQIGQAAQQLAQTPASGPFGRLVNLAKSPQTPDWLRKLADNPAIKAAYKLGSGAKASAAGAAKGAAKGAAVGAGVGFVSGDSPEEIGSDIAGFGAFGGLHGAEGSAKANIFNRRAAGVMDLVNKNLQDGVAPETLAKVPDAAMMAAADIPFLGIKDGQGRDLQVKFLDGAQMDARGQKGADGFYDDTDHTLTLNADNLANNKASWGSVFHEMLHPLFESEAANRPELSAAVDKAVTDAGKTLDQAKFTYTYNLLKPELRAQKIVDPLIVQKMVNDRVAQNDTSSVNRWGDKDHWIRSEILADAGRDALGTDTHISKPEGPINSFLKPSVSDTLKGVLSRMGVEFKSDRLGKSVIPGFDKVAADPALRKSVFNLLKAQRDLVPGMTKETEQGTKLTPQDMGGVKAPFYQLPNGRKGNKYSEVVPNGAGGEKVVMRNPKQVMRIEAKEAAAMKKYIKPGDRMDKMPPAFYADPDIGAWTKQAANLAEQSAAKGEALQAWYHGIGKSGQANWRKSVQRNLGNVTASHQQFYVMPKGLFISKKGNPLMDVFSLAALQRKAAKWVNRKGPLSLDLWGGNVESFLKDVDTYNKNHAANLPGDANNIGQDRRDVINAFLFGRNAKFEQNNKLRPSMRNAEDRQGIVRSLRLDRLETLEPSTTDLSRPDYDKGVKNFSPQAGDENLPPTINGERYVTIKKPDGSTYRAAYGDKSMDLSMLGRPSRAFVARLVPIGEKAELKWSHGLLGDGEEIIEDKPLESKQFSPQTEAGKKLEEKGLTLTKEDYHGGNIGIAVHDKDGNEVARLSVFQTSPTTASVGMIHTAEPYRKQGIAEAMYRELGEALKAKGVTKLVGTAVNDAIPGIRNRVFGPGKVVPGAANAWGAPTARVESQIRPNMRFSAESETTKPGARIPNRQVREVADAYVKSAAIANEPHRGYAEVNPELSKRVADWYEDAKHNPADSAVKKSYDAFGKETVDQWKAAEAAGMRFEPWTKEGQPYKNSADMAKDVQQNNHLYYFPSQGGFGGGKTAEDVSAHPLLAPSGVKDASGKDIPINDVFRAVHDYFGHSKEGFEFGPRGELNAYLEHSKMYSDEARPAMAAETMGQNSWVNFGKHLRDEKGNVPKKGEPGYKPLVERPFAEQKATVMPRELVDETGGSPETAPAKVIEDAAKERIQSSPQAVEPDEEGNNSPFYSQLRRVITDKFSGKEMPSAQLAALIRNSGVKQDEIKWSGIEDFLKSKPRVTAGEVSKFLNESEVKVGQVTKSRAKALDEFKQAIEDAINDTDEDSLDPTDYPEWAEDARFMRAKGEKALIALRKGDIDRAIEHVYDNYDMEDRYGDTPAWGHPNRMANSIVENGKNTEAADSPRFEEYSTPGGKNYREMLFTLPHQQGPSFRKGHFSEVPNVVAHARVSDFDDAGKPGLLVDEIQSDLHQQGRKNGYKGDPFPYDVTGWTAKEDEGDPASGPTWAVRDSNNRWVSGVPRKDFPTAEEAIEHAAEGFMEGRGKSRVPDAPFKTTWHEMVLRRLLYEAASTDKSWLGWITGKAQADRYDLSKHLDSIHYNPEAKLLYAYGRGQSEAAINRRGIEPGELEEVIGKEMTQRLLKTKLNGKGFHELNGLDLKVGGEGMGGFYDKILVDYANKFGKKFGSQVGERTIKDGEGYVSKIHSMPITPQMKESLKGGIAMFSPQAEHVVGDKEIPLVHLSSKTGLKSVDPKFFGKGRANNNDRRGAEKAYFFVRGSKLSGDAPIFGQGGYFAYGGNVNGNRIYDLSTGKPDPLGYFKTVNREEADDNLKGAGYHGVLVSTSDGRKVVMMFKKVPVKPLGQFKGGKAFSPEAEKKSQLPTRGFSVRPRPSGFDILFKNGVGKLQIDYGSEPKSAIVKAVDVNEDQMRRGIATAMYERAKKRLQALGITKLTGSLEGSGPVQIREKVFGPGNTKYFQGGAEIPTAEAQKIMDNYFGYVRAETTIPSLKK